MIGETVVLIVLSLPSLTVRVETPLDWEGSLVKLGHSGDFKGASSFLSRNLDYFGGYLFQLKIALVLNGIVWINVNLVSFCQFSSDTHPTAEGAQSHKTALPASKH